MKQRLAIAATLLKDPDLLIFDEPTNGLDPAGIHEIRATMRGLADRGKTVLVSSHILSRGPAGRRHRDDHRPRPAARRGRGRRHPRGRRPARRPGSGSTTRTAAAAAARAGRLRRRRSSRTDQLGGLGQRSSCDAVRRSPSCWPSRASTSPSSPRCGGTWSRCSSSSPPRKQLGGPPPAPPPASARRTEPAMIRLIRAETARLLSRRFTVITMIVVVLGDRRVPAGRDRRLQPAAGRAGSGPDR